MNHTNIKELLGQALMSEQVSENSYQMNGKTNKYLLEKAKEAWKAYDAELERLLGSCETSSIWQHVKSGGMYKVVGNFLLEADATTQMVAYIDVNDAEKRWVRPAREFYDGRFKRILNDK